MFTYSSCQEPGCNRNALSSFGSNEHFCLFHVPDKEKIKAKIYDYIRNHEKIIGLVANGIFFSDVDFSNKKFYGCSFQHCTFSNIKTENCRSRMSIFDFSIFTDCSFLKSNMQFTAFAGAAFSHVLLTGSDLIQNNFSGISAYQSSFDDSDLYNSRFIRAKLVNTSFRNCNVKKTIFFDIERTDVSFRMSNTREAIFDIDGSALMKSENALSEDFTE